MAQLGPSSASNFEFVKKHEVYETDKWRFVIEEYRRGVDQFFLVHALCKQFSASALREAKKAWLSFRQQYPVPLYAVRNDGSESKWKHFVTLFGFRPTGIHLPCDNGVLRELYISEIIDGRKQTINKRNVD